MGTIVLVHGAWHGGWCYSRVTKLLRARGHDVYAPTLTGLGERVHLYCPSVNASVHVRDIENVILFEDLHDVVLVGHSYSGILITAVADRLPERLRSLVYLDAFIGEDGKSTFDLDLPEAVAFHVDRAQHNGGHTIPPVPSASFGVNPADRAWVDSNYTPQPFATLAQRLCLSGRHESVRRRIYVEATEWTMSPFRRFGAIAKDDPTWEYRALACGHDVMVDMPQETADAIEAGL